MASYADGILSRPHLEGGAWRTSRIAPLSRSDADRARSRVLNRRITLVMEKRNSDPDAAEAWVPEAGFTYDPSALTTDAALDMRPIIDFAIRQLRVTGDYLDAWLKNRIRDTGENT